jgi:hypothetical protein
MHIYPLKYHGLAICYLPGKENLVKLRLCNHIFHLACIEEWIVHYRNSTCPICRQDIYSQQPVQSTTAPPLATVHNFVNGRWEIDDEQTVYELPADWATVMANERARRYVIIISVQWRILLGFHLIFHRELDPTQTQRQRAPRSLEAGGGDERRDEGGDGVVEDTENAEDTNVDIEGTLNGNG